MEERIPIHGSLTLASIEPLIGLCVGGDCLRGGIERLVIDLTEVTFAWPAPLVTLAALLSATLPIGLSVRLIVPIHEACRRYLAASGFIALLHQQGRIELDGVGDLAGYGPSQLVTVLPIVHLTAETDLTPLAHQVAERLDVVLGSGSSTWDIKRQAIVSTVRELCANIFHHSGGRSGYIAAQRYYVKTTGEPFVEIGIADLGDGIRQSLATRYAELGRESDARTLMRMLTENLTRVDEPHRGNGYWILQNATKDLKGSFELRSGSGSVSRAKDRGNLVARDEAVHLPGTHLRARFTCI